DENAAGRERAIHRFLSFSILPVPRAAVEIEDGGKRPGAGRLIDAGHQLPSGRVAPELDFAHRDLELAVRIVRELRRGGRTSRLGEMRSQGRHCRQAGCAECRYLHQEIPTSANGVHSDLLASTIVRSGIYSRSPKFTSRQARRNANRSGRMKTRTT